RVQRPKISHQLHQTYDPVELDRRERRRRSAVVSRDEALAGTGIESAQRREPREVEHRRSQHSILEVDETEPPVVEDIRRNQIVMTHDYARESAAIRARERAQLVREPALAVVETLVGACARQVL